MLAAAAVTALFVKRHRRQRERSLSDAESKREGAVGPHTTDPNPQVKFERLSQIGTEIDTAAE